MNDAYSNIFKNVFELSFSWKQWIKNMNPLFIIFTTDLICLHVG